jgi:antitoxin ParD1/3/4
MPTRNVVLTDHHERLIADLMASGRYQNASEILRDGLRLIEERGALEAAKLEALRAAAQVGVDAIEAGAFRAFERFDDMEVYLRAVTDPLLKS